LFLFFAALFQIADGAQVGFSGMLRGLHDARWPMIFAPMGYCGRVASLPVRARRYWHLDRTVIGIGHRRLPHDPLVATS
jgi:Na+-driven multidrug efflux pump